MHLHTQKISTFYTSCLGKVRFVLYSTLQKESGKHVYSASPSVHVINEQGMRKMLRLKAVTTTLCISKQGFLFRNLYSRPNSTQMDLGVAGFLSAQIEGCVWIICFTGTLVMKWKQANSKSKQQDSAPRRVKYKYIYRISMQWEILIVALDEIRAVNNCLQKRARPERIGCCSTSCSLCIYIYKLHTGKTVFKTQEQLNSLHGKLWNYSLWILQSLQSNKSKYENQVYS